ncbi:hypothetical protein JZ751_029819 [Albula glossodonta]|uniref:Inositol-pentakisphosphate 2-kinase n=1 Tax=Albula glossodonta TaxID=121402 RepID=A0A8T2NH99_9TELE|nr:hypothetical protein JZ751_029819 [Albula glossodonta]
MELDKMDENDWKYHGEGNKSLVVSHSQHSRVLRLLKYPAENAEYAHQTTEQAFRHIQNIVDFNKNVMRPLLGEKYVHHGEAVKLPLDFVRQLSLKVQQERPESRCDKVMDTFSGCAVCLPNLTHIISCHITEHRPSLCIEIKPKCGFLPFSRHVSKEVKRKVCRFCMHQHFKLANGKWKRMSRYCPLDLFSGNKQRMYIAIKHLLEEPQNNFRIFKNGQLIYSCKDDGDLNELIQQLKPYFFPSNGLINGHQSSKAVLNELIQMLDSLDIEGIYPLYKRVEQYLEEFPKERSRLQIDGPYNENFLEKVKNCPTEDDGSIEYAVGKVHQYRVAMTAKDCSVMITLAPCREEDRLEPDMEIQLSKPRFTYSVSILDLDPKPYENIPHQSKLDSKIVNYYLRSVQSKHEPPKANLYLGRDCADCTLVFHSV